ncbi:MAG: porin [Odoribacteraceae bacterium]|nr:porin [Odoribacteraceae bacterium]
MKTLAILSLLSRTPARRARLPLLHGLSWLLVLLFAPGVARAQEARLDAYTIGEGFTFSFPAINYSMTLRGYVQMQSDSRFYTGDADASHRFRVRRARLRLSGRLLDGRLTYRLTADFSESLSSDEANSLLHDAFIAYKPASGITITIGQAPVSTDSREMGISSNTLAFTDRSKLSSAFSTIREVGVSVEGDFRVGQRAVLRPEISVTDGDGSVTLSRRFGGLKYGARVNFLPFGRFRQFGEFSGTDLVREVAPRLSIGAAVSYNDGVSDRRGGRSSGDILYLDAGQRHLLPGYGKIVADFLFKYRGLYLLGEYARAWADVPGDIVYRVREDGSLATTFDGGVEAYVKGRMMLGSGINLEASYLFPRWLASAGARYTRLFPDDNSYLNNTLYYNRNTVHELSAAKYLNRSHAVKLQASVARVAAGEGNRDVSGNVFTGPEILFQCLLQVSF